VQAFPSSQAFELSVCTQPDAGLQLSSVQELPSLQIVGPPARHVPPVQESPVVQALPSSQGPRTPVKTQPVEGLQVSAVQILPSSQVAAAPEWHVPPEHVSPTVHGFFVVAGNRIVGVNAADRRIARVVRA
jgi:hypothetical protein